MRELIRLSALAAAATLLTACAGAAPAPTASPSADASTYWLRMTTFQAIPPANLFGVVPVVVITGDGTYVTTGPVPAIFPGPLLPNLVARPITDAGRTAIMAEAARLGLLGGATDFTGGASVPGAMTGRIELTLDGRRVTLTGDPNAQIQCITTPCDAPPGTPAAFGAFWTQLVNPGEWLGPALGPERSYVADSYALLVGPPPAPDAGLRPTIADWPLDTSLATFGGPVANGSYRCGLVSGAEADTLRPALEAADQLTQWVQDETTSATFGITVRPLVPGEDPCRELFGGGAG